MRKLLLAVAVLAAACGGDSPSSPSSVPAPPASGPVTLSGTVTAEGGVRLSGATVTILDGSNAGRSTTTSSGEYRLENLVAGNANVSATASGYEERRAGIALAPGSNALNFTTRTVAPWSRAGRGDNVFDMPTYISRVRITGACSCRSTNFIVRIAGRNVVNELLGTGWGSSTFAGTYTTAGGVVEILHSADVSWTFEEVR